MSPEDVRTWRAFLHASTRLLDRLDADLRERHGRPMSDFDVLSNLAEAPGRALRMSDLADQTLFSRSRLSHRIKILESEGLVERRAAADDGRGTLAHLTPAGLGLLRAMRRTHLEGIREYFTGHFDASEEDVIAEFMSRVVRGLGAEIVPPLA